MRELSFMTAMTKTIGPIEGQSKMGFGKECQQLSLADRAWFVERLRIEHDIVVSNAVPMKL